MAERDASTHGGDCHDPGHHHHHSESGDKDFFSQKAAGWDKVAWGQNRTKNTVEFLQRQFGEEFLKVDCN